MTRSKFIADRLNEVLLNGYWIANTNCKAQIESLNWKQAIYTVENLNSIAALTYHINYYLAGILNVFNGGDLEIRDKFSFDLPTITSEEEWRKLISTFCSNSEKFIEHVENMDDSILDKPFVNEKYGTYQRNIEGVIEHCYYHLGQISLIKKLILKGE
ncbi:MAG: DUF1572 domain-containing protein [Thalassobius sp.]|nr:DUF1572 domain-containing protein [Thalassovita sp.]